VHFKKEQFEALAEARVHSVLIRFIDFLMIKVFGMQNHLNRFLMLKLCFLYPAFCSIQLYSSSVVRLNPSISLALFFALVIAALTP